MFFGGTARRRSDFYYCVMHETISVFVYDTYFFFRESLQCVYLMFVMFVLVPPALASKLYVVFRLFAFFGRVCLSFF